MIIREKSFGRAGLLGNPSDGYYGKTIALSLVDFPCEVTIYESPEVRIEPGRADRSQFPDLSSLVREVDHFGYYGGVRLVKATIRQFVSYCEQHGIVLPSRNFSLRYASSVPQLVGFGGSSAICTATFKALQRFYGVSCPEALAPTYCWRAELSLGIQCGMQDRVIQIYNGVVFMDFAEDYFQAHDHGRYERLSSGLLPSLYVAWSPEGAECSGIYHGKLRSLFEAHHDDLVASMSEFAELAQRGRDALVGGRLEELPGLIDANFDLRRRVLRVSSDHQRMVEAARLAGASAKFAGSGGAIIGTYVDEAMYLALSRRLQDLGCRVAKVRVAEAECV